MKVNCRISLACSVLTCLGLLCLALPVGTQDIVRAEKSFEKIYTPDAKEKMTIMTEKSMAVKIEDADFGGKFIGC